MAPCGRALVGLEAHNCRKAWRKVPEQETNEEEEDCSTGKRSAYFLERKQEAGRRGRGHIEMAMDSEIVVPCYHGTVLDKKKKRPVPEALSANRNTAQPKKPDAKERMWIMRTHLKSAALLLRNKQPSCLTVALISLMSKGVWVLCISTPSLTVSYSLQGQWSSLRAHGSCGWRGGCRGRSPLGAHADGIGHDLGTSPLAHAAGVGHGFGDDFPRTTSCSWDWPWLGGVSHRSSSNWGLSMVGWGGSLLGTYEVGGWPWLTLFPGVGGLMQLGVGHGWGSPLSAKQEKGVISLLRGSGPLSDRAESLSSCLASDQTSPSMVHHSPSSTTPAQQGPHNRQQG